MAVFTLAMVICVFCATASLSEQQDTSQQSTSPTADNNNNTGASYETSVVHDSSSPISSTASSSAVATGDITTVSTDTTSSPNTSSSPISSTASSSATATTDITTVSTDTTSSANASSSPISSTASSSATATTDITTVSTDTTSSPFASSPITSTTFPSATTANKITTDSTNTTSLPNTSSSFSTLTTSRPSPYNQTQPLTSTTGVNHGNNNTSDADQTELPRHLLISVIPAVGGSMFLAIMTTVVILRMRRRRNAKSPTNQSSALNQRHTKRCKKDIKNKGGVIIYMNENGGMYENFTPGDITVSELKTYVIEKMKTGGLAGEYKALPSGLKAKHEVAKSTLNRHKNRFRNIFAYDESRVRLQRSNNTETDYINASYITGYNGKRQAYIAAQGPNEHTVDDFWLMIWQEGVDCVVMLTNLVENNRIKCEKYWPEKGVKECHGDIEVSCISTTTNGSVTRTLQLHNTRDKITRQVTQFHFVTWPDHGVASAPSLVKFWKQVKQHVVSSEKPLLVHCSAGIGRTGTFIGLDILMERSKAQNTVNVFQCVQTIRKERVDAIQTKSQYVFVHEALVEALYSTETNLSETELSSRVDQGRELIQTEYLKLKELQELTSPSAEKASTSKDEELTSIYIPCPLLEEAFLVPISKPDDLLETIDSKSVKAVVAICSDGFPGMIPTAVGESVQKGNSSITMTSLSDVTDCLREINIVIETATNTYENTEPKQVTLFVMKSRVTSSIPDTLALLEKLEQHRTTNGDTIMVYSIPDISAAILLCTISNIIATLQQHHEVDIFLTVREMTCLMPSFQITQEDYEFLYDLSQEYINSRNVYANIG